MLYYLMLVPAVLSTAVIYFLSPALSYWWLLPVLLVCSGGDVGRAVVAGRHRTRGGDRQLECGELAEQQHGQQQGKDSGCVFAGYHCK